MRYYCLASALFNASATALLGILVFTRDRRDPRIRSFTLVAAFIVAWSLCYYFWQLSHDAADALLWCRLLTASAILIPPAYFDFTNDLLRESRPRETWAGYGVAALLSGLSFTPWMVDSVLPKHGFAWWPVPGDLYPLYLSFFFWYIFRSAVLMLRALRQSSGLMKNQLSYVLAMTLLGYMGGSTNFFLWYDINVPPLGNALVGVYMVGVAYAVVRLRLLAFNVLVARALVYLTLIPVLASLTPLGFFALSWYAEGDIRLFAQLVIPSVLSAGVVFAIAPLIQRRVNALLDTHISPAKAVSRDKIKSLGSSLWLAPDEASLLRMLGENVGAAYGVGAVAVYWRRDTGIEALNACHMTPAAKASGWPAEWGRELEEAMTRHNRRGAWVIEEALQSWDSPLAKIAHQMKHVWGMRLLVPIHSREETIALVVLGTFPGSEVFSTAELEQLETLCMQAGLAITARRMERERGLSEKLISLGTMAAGFAHEIRNPLTSLRTFCDLVAEQGTQNTEIAAEMLDIMRRDIDRINGIIDNVTHLATNTRVAMQPALLQPLLAQAEELSRRNRPYAAPIVVQMPDDAPVTVRANQNQLVQIFANLFNNAHDALEGKADGRIRVQVTRREPDYAVIAIHDNGPGIHPTVLRHLFEPFVTTKAVGDRKRDAGMGIGLAIVRLLVQGHGGTVSAENHPAGGALFTLTLPLSESKP